MSLAVPQTSYPRSDNNSAVARPMPELAPVRKTVLVGAEVLTRVGRTIAPKIALGALLYNPK